MFQSGDLAIVVNDKSRDEKSRQITILYIKELHINCLPIDEYKIMYQKKPRCIF
jgi:hypothetical protein